MQYAYYHFGRFRWKNLYKNVVKVLSRRFQKYFCHFGILLLTFVPFWHII
nr:MAG TPA: hypothetical protein [Caudoviricetes sp.]